MNGKVTQKPTTCNQVINLGDDDRGSSVSMNIIKKHPRSRVERNVVSRALHIFTSCMNFLQTGRMSFDSVAENIITCFECGVARKISWMSRRMSAQHKSVYNCNYSTSQNKKLLNLVCGKDYRAARGWTFITITNRPHKCLSPLPTAPTSTCTKSDTNTVECMIGVLATICPIIPVIVIPVFLAVFIGTCMPLTCTALM